MLSSRVGSPVAASSPLPSPPPGLPPIAEHESSDVSLGLDSEEMRHAQEIIPPDDSIPEVHAIPAFSGISESESPAPPIASPRRISISLPSPFRYSKGGCSRCTMWLALLFVLFLMLSIALFIVWAVTSDGFSNLGKQPHVCSTKQCISTAFRMSSYMDDTVPPCDNFYRYACGKFHAMTRDKQQNFLDQQKEAVSRSVYSLLSTAPYEGLRSERLAKAIFSSCMDAPARATVGGYPLLSLLRNFPCGPIMTGCDFHPESYNWARHNGMLDWYAGEFPLIVYGRDVHPSDRSKLILQLRAPDLRPLLDPLREELIRLANPSVNEIDPLLQLSIRQNLLNDMVSRQIMRDPREVEDQLDEVAFLFIEIDRMTRSSLPTNVTYLTIGELAATIPQINFTEMFNAQLTSLFLWTNEDIVAIENMDYLLMLSQALPTISPRALANFLVSVSALHLRRYSYDPRIQFSPMNSSEISWRECVADSSDLTAVEKMYITQHNVPISKIQKFLDTSKKDFLSNHRPYAPSTLAEVNRLSFLVGYPSRKTKEDLVWRPLSDLRINQSDYFYSITSALKAQRNFDMAQLGTHLDKDDAPIYPILTPTIVYQSRSSNLVYPLSFLQEPLVYPGELAPWDVVYGTLGVVTQQMISKIFWEKMDQRSKQQCFEDIFRSFLNPDLRNNVNIVRDLTYTVEMADALRTTLYGYQKWQTDNHNFDEKAMPAFEALDNVQTLLLSYGALFCNTEAEVPGSEYEAMMNTVMSNSQLFSMHFHCSNSSAIYFRRLCV